MRIKSLHISSLDQDHLNVEWVLEGSSMRTSRVHVFVERSVDGPAGPWLERAGPFINSGHFQDPDINPHHPHRRYFYRLRLLDRDTGETSWSDAATSEAEQDVLAAEMSRRMNLMLEEWGGRRLVVFPAITAGIRCHNCVDVRNGRSTGRRITQNCEDCFDTTFLGGFATPILVWGQIDPNPKRIMRTDTNELALDDTTMRISNFPILKPKDMIVEAENIRWEVQVVPVIRKNRAIVHQEPQIHRIPTSDVRYRVPVDPAVFTRPNGSDREFTRPMCLQGED